jgi:hypothetical protein
MCLNPPYRGAQEFVVLFGPLRHAAVAAANQRACWRTGWPYLLPITLSNTSVVGASAIDASRLPGIFTAAQGWSDRLRAATDAALALAQLTDRVAVERGRCWARFGHQWEAIVKLAGQFGASKTEIVVALLNAGLDRWRSRRRP